MFVQMFPIYIHINICRVRRVESYLCSLKLQYPVLSIGVIAAPTHEISTMLNAKSDNGHKMLILKFERVAGLQVQQQ